MGGDCGTRDILRNGVGIMAYFYLPGVGDVSPDGFGVEDLRSVIVDVGCGTPESRRRFIERAVVLPKELSRRLEPPS